VPLGYLGDPAKTAGTFPVVDGIRYAVAGDRARVLGDGSIELHGRDSVTINTGGEKVFAEEVGAHLVRFKVPKAYLWVEQVERSPSGKPDYRWAAEQARPAHPS